MNASHERNGPKILVTYASVHGATQEVTERVAGMLRERGQAVGP